MNNININPVKILIHNFYEKVYKLMNHYLLKIKIIDYKKNYFLFNIIFNVNLG